jgi:hypothetical protein
MDDSFRQQESESQQPSGFSASLQIFDGILPLVHKSLNLLKEITSKNHNSGLVMRHSVNWLAGLIQLTEEEQKDAGIYLDDQRNK